MQHQCCCCACLPSGQQSSRPSPKKRAPKLSRKERVRLEKVKEMLGPAAASSAQSPEGPPAHLVVFIHGFEGTYADFLNAERRLLEEFEADAHRHHERIRVLLPKGNSQFMGTYDGIEKGAVRIWREVMQTVWDMKEPLAGISLVGHSLGGLYARFLARLLDDCFLFERAEARFFVTLASPHLSVRRPINGPINFAFQKVASVACRTSSELCLEDDAANPLLFRMVDQSFIGVLRKFKRRILYSNVYNDFQVHFSTASISLRNPYAQNGALATRSPHYPDLTDYSLSSVQERLQHALDDIDAFAKNDPKAKFLRIMFLQLNSLEWERYDALFPTVFAHEQIINKRSAFAGKHVIQHLCDVILHRGGGQQSDVQQQERNEVAARIKSEVDARKLKPGEHTLSQV